VLHTPVPAFDHVRVGDVTLTEIVPTEYRADLVLLLEGADGAAPATALVVEAQLGRDADIAAARDLDDERSKLYADLVLASVDEAARAILEALMASGNYEYQSDFARRYVAEGKAEGRAEGGAHAILAVLAARGLDVPDEVRARITACTDLARLDAWLARAVTASSAAEVIGE